MFLVLPILVYITAIVHSTTGHNCQNVHQVEPRDFRVKGPNGNAITQDIKDGNFNLIMTENKDEANFMIYDFSPPTTLSKIHMRTKLCRRIAALFYDEDGNEIRRETVFPPQPDSTSSHDSYMDLGDDPVEKVSQIKFRFKSSYFEWKVKSIQFTGCVQPDEPCTCRLRGDPILDNCNSNLWFLGEGLYTFSESAQCGGYEVTIFNSKLNENPNALTVTEYMRIESQGNSIQIDRDAMVSINDDEAVPASDGPVGSWATILVNPNNYVSVQLNACGAVFQFWGQNMATRGMGIIPASIKGSASGKCHEDP